MNIKLLRTNGNNINNNDDYIPFKYAYGDIDGYTGAFPFSVQGNSLHIGTTRLIVQGVESLIEGGIDIQFDIVGEKRYVLVYLSVNMQTQTSSILTKYSTNSSGVYQGLKYEDITSVYGSGIAEVPLISLEIENGVISNEKRLVERIPFVKDIKVKKSEFSDEAQFGYVAETMDLNNESERIATTRFVNSKLRETINLKTETLKISFITINLYKISNLVFGVITGHARSRGGGSLVDDVYAFEFSKDFRPKEDINLLSCGAGQIDTTYPAQVLTSGITKAGNNFVVYVNYGGTLETDGKFYFGLAGERDSSSTENMLHPIYYPFVYEAGVYD